ncbi:uncharacterized protein LOC133730693 [Rosa rugosa]|uniref:uncharacterized protein LOC133730693 n=1 Tax=Rosa rugosa TaxID=74645 RepID=UPI002B405A96|nr:uncharacterized protein LOC133730693 [Rosa rugosa]
MHQGNVLVWNCRGIVNLETQSALVDIVQAKKPTLIFLSETWAPKNLIDSLTRKLGFKGGFCVPHENDSQGLALLWSDETHVDIRTYSPNHIDAEVGKPGTDLWRFTGIYGVAARDGRNRTWSLIETLAAQPCSLPWLMAGDFNEVMSNADKSGGPPRAAAAMARFRRTMSVCGLIDMGFVGSRFTWSNRFTKERLDRGFQSMQWRTRFPFSRAVTLPPSESDHIPILIEVSDERLARGKIQRRFRFEEAWYGRQECDQIITQEWAQPTTGNALRQLGHKIKCAGKRLMEWH